MFYNQLFWRINLWVYKCCSHRCEPLYCIGSAHLSAVASLIIIYTDSYVRSFSFSSFHIMLEYYLTILSYIYSIFSISSFFVSSSTYKMHHTLGSCIWDMTILACILCRPGALAGFFSSSDHQFAATWVFFKNTASPMTLNIRAYLMGSGGYWG